MVDAALTGLLGVLVGGMIGGVSSYLLAERQNGFLRDERKAQEAERASIRLEESEREQRRERVRGIRESLDTISRFAGYKSHSDYNVAFVANVQKRPLLEVQNEFRVKPDYQAELIDLLKAISVAHDRAPERIASKIADLIRLTGVISYYNRADEMATAAYLMKAAILHEAVEEYITTGLVDGQSPSLPPAERERAVQDFLNVLQAMQGAQADADNPQGGPGANVQAP